MLKAAVAFVVVISGCATTINESAPTTTVENPSVEDLTTLSTIATIDPRLESDELLAQMLQNVD
ncbi:MAG: hypothetical protein EB142_07470, partial [Actinobacteria bacterium]|nr:hypothetical protein [Actinomycetota bacterium]